MKKRCEFPLSASAEGKIRRCTLVYKVSALLIFEI
jgi:hypothetical protein